LKVIFKLLIIIIVTIIFGLGGGLENDSIKFGTYVISVAIGCGLIATILKVEGLYGRRTKSIREED